MKTDTSIADARDAHLSRVADLAATLIEGATEIAKLASGAHPSEPRLATMLGELAAAQRDADAHVERYRLEPRTLGTYACTEDRDGWQRICRRRDEAIAALTAYALARFS